MKKILISGAAGFVGKNLVPQFIAKNEISELILIDKNPLLLNFIDYWENKRIKISFIVSDKIPVDPSTQDVDGVICLAGATSVDAALLDPKSAIEENIAIAVDMAEWARLFNPHAKIIYLSSDEVLGESYNALPEDSPLNPTQPYAISKSTAELILHNYRDIYSLNIVTIRSCNLIGYGQKIPKLIPTAIHSLLNNTPIPIHGDGNQLREWMDVDDLCQAILFLLNNDVESCVYQATTNIKKSVNEIVEIISNATNLEPQKKFVKDRLVQDHSYSMLPTRLNKLGWHPKYDPCTSIRQIAINALEESLNHVDV